MTYCLICLISIVHIPRCFPKLNRCSCDKNIVSLNLPLETINKKGKWSKPWVSNTVLPFTSPELFLPPCIVVILIEILLK